MRKVFLVGQMKTPNDVRTEICNAISEMLDNPDSIGIYKTTKCYDRLEKWVTTYAEEKVNEAIEECAKVADSRCSDRTAKAIRELKAKQK